MIHGFSSNPPEAADAPRSDRGGGVAFQLREFPFNDQIVKMDDLMFL
jgi:hypothetical protein